MAKSKNDQDIEEVMDSFLPEGETIPKSESNYMKLELPENKFRALSSATTGWELWVKGKPGRRKTKEEFLPEELQGSDTNKFTGKKMIPQYFWAFVVYNYASKKVEILEIKQKSVMHGIEDYLNDVDYGSPKKYDLNIIRDDTSGKVEYRVKAKPPKDLEEGIMQVYSDMKINLEALFLGESPFQSE